MSIGLVDIDRCLATIECFLLLCHTADELVEELIDGAAVVPHTPARTQIEDVAAYLKKLQGRAKKIKALIGH